jgi:ABC-type nitrate/sulfonate/bicarbonate transport system permease component
MSGRIDSADAVKGVQVDREEHADGHEKELGTLIVGSAGRALAGLALGGGFGLLLGLLTGTFRTAEHLLDTTRCRTTGSRAE